VCKSLKSFKEIDDFEKKKLVMSLKINDKCPLHVCNQKIFYEKGP
jgi:hypothetical protein